MTNQNLENIKKILKHVTDHSNIKWEVREVEAQPSFTQKMFSWLIEPQLTSKYILLCSQDLKNKEVDNIETADDSAVDELTVVDCSVDGNPEVTYEVVVAYLLGILHGIEIESTCIVQVYYPK
jgi:hypothetical protein